MSPAADKTPDDLTRLKRDELEKVAAKAGVPNPDALPNKDAIVEAIEGPNPALAPEPEPDPGELSWKVIGPATVHDTKPGGTFAARPSPQTALLVESGHIEQLTTEA